MLHRTAPAGFNHCTMTAAPASPVPSLAAGCEHIHANGLSQFSHYTQQVEKKSVICWLKRPRLKTVECAQNSAHNQ